MNFSERLRYAMNIRKIKKVTVFEDDIDIEIVVTFNGGGEPYREIVTINIKDYRR